MKNLSLTIAFLAIFSFNNFAQTKKTTTTSTTKKTTTVAKKPTTTAKTTTKPVTTKTSTTTVAKPTVTTTTTKVIPVAETPIVTEPSGPPVTGPIDSGPKSYSNTTTNSSTINNGKAATTKTKTAPTPKTDYKRKSNNGPRNYFGIRGGYNLATISDLDQLLSSTNKNEFQSGLMGGLFFNFGISKSFSIQPEFLYSQQGFKISENTEYLKAKVDVAQLPILLKLALGGDNIKFLINAGPYIGYKLKQTSITNITGTEVTESEPFDTDGADGATANRFEYGAIGGAGFQFNLGGALLSIEGRYNYGLSEPEKYTQTKPAELVDFGYHRVITGTIGLAFPIGK